MLIVHARSWKTIDCAVWYLAYAQDRLSHKPIQFPNALVPHRLFELDGGGGSFSVCHSAEDNDGKFATRLCARGVSEGTRGSCALVCSTLDSCIDMDENVR